MILLNLIKRLSMPMVEINAYEIETNLCETQPETQLTQNIYTNNINNPFIFLFAFLHVFHYKIKTNFKIFRFSSIFHRKTNKESS